MIEVLKKLELSDIKVVIKKNKKSSVVIIPLPNNLLLVRAPDLKNAYEHIKENIEWIKQVFDKHNNHYFNVKRNINNGLLLFKGNYISIVLDNGKLNRVSLKKDKIFVKHNGQMSLIDILKRFLKKYAKKEFLLMLDEYSKKLGVEFKSLKIKDTKSRWGSCSSKRNINLSFRLIMAPEYVYKYVIIHELSHIKFANHSKYFWNYLKLFCPEYKVAKKWLKENGIYLHTI